jgi:aspartyl-tRNA(Asn)/glutamyl-tRNA(Gln) amidotransferase subunit B
MDYEAVIGLEVHVQLLTASKMFCGCSADVFAAPPNTHVCPVCLGMPGSLPVINRRAIEATIMTGLALNCQIAEASVFVRKNYSYPDLPKGYQISQYELPLCYDGWLWIEVGGERKRIGIRRAHQEEDTGKLFHVDGYSLVDFNRSGVPLLEIVSEPDIRSADEAYAYLTKLRTILRYLGVSTGDMEKGAMRCEPSVSVRPVGSSGLGTKVEIKNLNSFRAVKLALEYEIGRQIEALRRGEKIAQVTMGWDDVRGRTVVQRVKEGSEDYRYFPEPDLPPLAVSREWVAEIAARLPELPDAKRERFMAQYGLSGYDASLLVADREVADYFERVAAASRAKADAKTVANWFTGELFRLMNETGLNIGQVKVTPDAFAELLALVAEGTVNLNTAKAVFEEMFRSGQGAKEIVAAKGLAQVSDRGLLAEVVRKTLAAHPAEVASYHGGKTTVLGWLMGQVMRATGGKANPALVRQILEEELRQKM